MPDLVKLREQIAAGEYRLDAASVASALLAYADAAEPAGPSPAAARRESEHGPPPAGGRDARTRRRASG